ncbi:MAG: DUF3570 domain-containing protein [Sediminicola sp.]
MGPIHKFVFFIILLFSIIGGAQSQDAYQKRVLETTEVDLLSSYYSQDGDNAAVSGGLGSEELTDATAGIIVSIPLNADDILTIDTGISAYTSASSSNVDPFDGNDPADPFIASSGASSNDLWANMTGSYSHSSDDRNDIWSAKLSVSSEYDYFSVGFGGSYAKLFNDRNTEVSLNGNVYLDSWKIIYPMELRPFVDGADGLNNGFFIQNTITGNTDYAPSFSELDKQNRNSYSLGAGFSQILSENVQASLSLDYVQQQGLLSTPFQRVYFNDVDPSFIDGFRLADDVERLPSSRSKIALGGRLNYFINASLTLRSYYRYYVDDWGITSHTASLEIPVKIGDLFTLYPSYRYYRQTAADQFAQFGEHLSSSEFHTSDYDLSAYSADQFGFGIRYTDILTRSQLWKLGLKAIDLKFNHYKRNTGLQATMVTASFTFLVL